MPLQATSGAASYDAFGGGVAVVPNYIEEVFATHLYTGNGSTQTITNGIDLAGKGGLVWTKNRTSANFHNLEDTVRGVNKVLFSNSTKNLSLIKNITVSSSGYFIRNYVNYNTSFDLNALLTPIQLNVGDVLRPPLADFFYNLTVNLSNHTVSIDNYCVYVEGDTYNGTWCYNKNDLYLNDIVVFVNYTTLDCYLNVSSDFNQYSVFYEWFNKSNVVIKNGTSLCEHEEKCTVDTLESSYVKANDTLQCKVTITRDFFTWYNYSDIKNTSTIGECIGSNQYPILNMSYFDEKTNEPITVNNGYSILGYDVNFFDGTNELNIQGNFTGNKSDLLCTDVNPAINTINLIVYGNWFLSKENYVTRAISIPRSEGIGISNNPIGYIPFHLLKVNESATISYTWQSTDWKLIEGFMLIYKCKNDGSKTLLDSTLIANGFATANLQLFTTPYSYEVEIDGTTYTDDSFTTCHIESTTERDFYIDLLGDASKAVTGLFFVTCDLEKIADNIVKMTWNANEDDDSDITGCIIGQRGTVTGKKEMYRNCTTGKTGSFTRTVTNDGNSYYVIGEITQGTNTRQCKDTINFFTQSTTADKFGLNGLLAIVLLIMCCALLYAGDGELAIGGAIIGIVLSWGIGILSIPWTTMSEIVSFAVIIAVIGRYSKKRATE